MSVLFYSLRPGSIRAILTYVGYFLKYVDLLGFFVLLAYRHSSVI